MIAAMGLLLGAVAVQAADRLPNIVLIYTDDLGYGDTSIYGGTKIHTPNIDRLAHEGRRFTDAHAASSVCSPSRYALVTGRYPFRIGLNRPIFAKSPLVIDPDRVSIADMLKRAGYATAIIGKWHLGFGVKTPDWNGDLKPGPLELGFDYYFGIPVVNSHSPFVYVENHRVVGLDPNDPLVYGGEQDTTPYPEKFNSPRMSGAKKAHELYNETDLGDTLTAKAVDWMKDHQDKPFFLLYTTPQIHHPFTPNKRFVGTSECGRYGDWIEELDSVVGRVYKALEQMDQLDNTLVIFTSDNGAMLNQGGQNAVKLGHHVNGGLLGFKFDAWEGGHRVPFIVRWPGKVQPDSVSDQLISSIDLYATFAAIVGQKLGPEDAPDSLDVLSTWTDDVKEPSTRDELVVMPNHVSHLMLREGDWVYIGARGGGGFSSPRLGMHTFGGPAALKFTGESNSDVANGKFKPDAPDAQLYNVSNDRAQTSNVINDYPEIAQKLAARLQEIQKSDHTAPSR